MTSPARLRQRLQRLRDEHARLLQAAFDTSPLWRGQVRHVQRKCGKPTCRCTRGERHAATVLADRSGSGLRNFTPKGKDLDRFTEMTEAYRELRQRRSRLVEIQGEMLRIFDALESTRRDLAVRRFGGRLSARGPGGT